MLLELCVVHVFRERNNDLATVLNRCIDRKLREAGS